MYNDFTNQLQGTLAHPTDHAIPHEPRIEGNQQLGDLIKSLFMTLIFLKVFKLFPITRGLI